MKQNKLFLLILVCVLLFTACQKEPLVIKDSEECIVIKATDEALNGKTDMVLIDYMKQLAGDKVLDCTIENGMITSINGIQNAADFSSCWMLYTSDTDNANTAWGTVEYDGQTYGSAISGAETLVVKPGQLYIWVYQSF